MNPIGDDEEMTAEHYLAEHPLGLTFLDCVREAARNPEMLEQVDRLLGTNLRRRGSGLELLIDDATGRTRDDIGKFLRFVWNCIFIRLDGNRERA